MTAALLVAVPVVGDGTAPYAAGGPFAVAAAADPADRDPVREGNYVTLPQVLLADTRTGTGVPQARIAAGQTLEVQVTGRGGIPATVSEVEAVALDITTTNSTVNAPLQIWPSGTTRPSATMHTAMPGEQLSNIAFVKPGANGRVSIYNGAGQTDLLLRSTGYFTTAQEGAGFKVLNQGRVADTRSGSGVRQGQIPSGGGVTVSLTGAGVPTTASSAAVTLVMIAQNNGFVNAGIPDDPNGKSGASYAAGQNAVTKVVPIKNGQLQVINGGTNGIDLLVDVQGYFGASDSGGGFHPTSTGRIYDSRSAGTGGAIPAGQTRTIPVLGQGEVPKRRVGAAMLSLTVTGQTAPGVLAVTAESLTPNPASNLNYEAGQVRTNSLIVPTNLPATGKIVVKNDGSTAAHVVIDAEGWFDPYFDPDPSNAFPAGPGERDFSTFTDAALNDRTTARANAVNGNLLVSVGEINISGRGIDMSLGRHYNSRTDAGVRDSIESGRTSSGIAENGAFGPGWTMDATGDVRLVASGPNRVFHGTTGSEVTFTPKSGGGWNTPTGMTATLRNVSGGFELRMDKPGEKWNFTTDGRLTSLVDRNGNTITYTAGTGGRLDRITDTRGRDLVFTWATPSGAAAPVVSRITDTTSNRVWQYSYSAGRLASATDANGNVVNYSYNAAGQLATIGDFRGVLAVMTYDIHGRVTNLERPLTGSTGGPTTSFSYADGRTRVVDARGKTTTYVYDYLGRITDVWDHLRNDRSTDYDLNSNVTAYTPTTGQATGSGVTNTYSDNGRNNLTGSQLSTGAASTFEYADGGTNDWAPSKVTDSQGSSTTYTYDARGNETSATDSDAEATSSRVDRNSDGQVSVAYDAKGTVTRYSYNARGELTTIDHPAPFGDEQYTYDSLSRMLTATDGKGTVTRYAYDALDRVTSVTTGSDSVDDVYYTYDGAGNRTRETDDAGDDFSTYDRHNRVTVEQRAIGGEQRYTYDPIGNLTGLTSSSPGGNRQWTYEYDDVNRAIAAVDPSGNRVAFGYNDDNERTSTTFPGGTVETTTRDKSGRATRIRATNGSAVLTDVSYTYAKAAGGDGTLVQTRTDHVGLGGPAGSRTTYTYDGKQRLVKADERTSSGGAHAAWEYAYDANGNRTRQILSGSTGSGTSPGTTTYAYNAVDQLTAVNGSTAGWSYDANGNELGGGSSRSSLGVPARSSEYNRLDQVRSTTASGVRDSFTYSGTNNSQRLRASGTTFARSAVGMLGTSSTSGNVNLVTLDPDGQVISSTINGVTQYHLTDNLGSVIALVDGNGTRTATYSYDPYGIGRTTTGSLAGSNPYRYTGGYLDVQSGLYKLGVRYYDPTVGRFTQPDPTGQEVATYLYATGNPVNYVDSTGAAAHFIPIAAIGIARWVGTASKGVTSYGPSTAARAAGGSMRNTTMQNNVIQTAKQAKRTGLSRQAGDDLAHRAQAAGVRGGSHGSSTRTRSNDGHTCIGGGSDTSHIQCR